MNLSFKNIFYVLASVLLMFASLILARSLLIPLAFALLIAFILLPLANKIESWGIGRIPAGIFTVLIMILILGAGITFFSTQILQLTLELTNFQDRIIATFADITLYLNQNLNIIDNLDKDELYLRIKGWITGSAGYLVQQTFTNSATFIAGLGATVIYIFLLLIYRGGLTEAMAHFYPVEQRRRAIRLFKKIQQVGKKYLMGVIILIVVIGFTNSIGLWIIGIENPFLFGFLGALLSIVPYIGTILGAIIPILYVLIAKDSLGMAVAIGILFWSVQLISDNFLSPKIVGGSLRVNAFAAILSLIVGALVWGIAGMILFLPFTAVLLVISEEYKELKPVGMLIGTYESPKEDKFKGVKKTQSVLRRIMRYLQPQRK